MVSVGGGGGGRGGEHLYICIPAIKCQILLPVSPVRQFYANFQHLCSVSALMTEQMSRGLFLSVLCGAVWPVWMVELTCKSGDINITMYEVRHTLTPCPQCAVSMIIITHIAASQWQWAVFVQARVSAGRSKSYNAVLSVLLVISLSLRWSAEQQRSLAVYDYQRNISHLSQLFPTNQPRSTDISHSYFTIRINLSETGRRWGQDGQVEGRMIFLN